MNESEKLDGDRRSTHEEGGQIEGQGEGCHEEEGKVWAEQRSTFEEDEYLDAEEKIRAENDFLKMKIMAQHGGEFHSGGTQRELPAEIENEFLSTILEFEEQFSKCGNITIFKKIGEPGHFPPQEAVKDDDIGRAWQDLSKYMGEHGVELTSLSPKVTPRQLYQFALEELFQHETADIDIPGMINGFIYDEFYPDHEYNNTCDAIDYCIRKIFCKENFGCTLFLGEEVRLNEKPALKKSEVQRIINRFKECYDHIGLDDVVSTSVASVDNSCVVRGEYRAHVSFGNTTEERLGGWSVEFARSADGDDWSITAITIEGIPF